MIRLLLTLSAAFTCFAASFSFGEESARPGVRALLLVPGGPVIKIHPMVGETVAPAVQIGARGLSESFRPPAREFSLAVSDTSQESGYRAVGNVSLPDHGKDFILLLEPVKKTFKAHVIHARESRFSEGGLLFFNASDTVLGASLGATKVLIQQRVAVFAKAPARGEKPYYQVTFYQPDDDKTRPFTNTRWPHRNSSRCYVFFYRSETGRLTYQAVDEYLAPALSLE